MSSSGGAEQRRRLVEPDRVERFRAGRRAGEAADGKVGHGGDDVDDLVPLVAVEVGDADQAGGVTEPSSVTSSVSPVAYATRTVMAARGSLPPVGGRRAVEQRHGVDRPGRRRRRPRPAPRRRSRLATGTAPCSCRPSPTYRCRPRPGPPPGRRRLDAVGLVADEQRRADAGQGHHGGGRRSHRRFRRQRQPGAPAMPVRAAILSQASGSSVAVAASSSSRVTSASDVGAVTAHRSTTIRSWASPRWSCDLTVPVPQPRASAISARGRSA